MKMFCVVEIMGAMLMVKEFLSRTVRDISFHDVPDESNVPRKNPDGDVHLPHESNNHSDST